MNKIKKIVFVLTLLLGVLPLVNISHASEQIVTEQAPQDALANGKPIEYNPIFDNEVVDTVNKEVDGVQTVTKFNKNNEVIFDLNDYKYTIDDANKTIIINGYKGLLDCDVISERKAVMVYPGEFNGYQIKITQALPVIFANQDNVDTNRFLWPRVYGISYKTVNNKKVIQDWDVPDDTFYPDKRRLPMISKILDIRGMEMPKEQKSIAGLFQSRNSVEILGIETLDVSNIEVMSSLFANTDLKQCYYEAISGWDVSKVKNMNNLFSVSGLRGNFDAVKNWNTQSLEQFFAPFSHLYQDRVTGIDLSGWHTPNLKVFGHAFCSLNIRYINLQNFDTSNVVNLDYPFGAEFGSPEPGVNTNIHDTNYNKWENLVVITNDQKLLDYDYSLAYKTPYIPKFNTNGGTFSNGQTEYIANNAKVAIPSDSEEGINQYITSLVEQPTKPGYTFTNWTLDPTVNNNPNTRAMQRQTETFTNKIDSVIAELTGTYLANYSLIPAQPAPTPVVKPTPKVETPVNNVAIKTGAGTVGGIGLIVIILASIGIVVLKRNRK